MVFILHSYYIPLKCTFARQLAFIYQHFTNFHITFIQISLTWCPWHCSFVSKVYQISKLKKNTVIFDNSLLNFHLGDGDSGFTQESVTKHMTTIYNHLYTANLGTSLPYSINTKYGQHSPHGAKEHIWKLSLKPYFGQVCLFHFVSSYSPHDVKENINNHSGTFS